MPEPANMHFSPSVLLPLSLSPFLPTLTFSYYLYGLGDSSTHWPGNLDLVVTGVDAVAVSDDDVIGAGGGEMTNKCRRGECHQ